MNLLVGLSRVYNLNHFPHQCVAALVFGALVIKLVYKNDSFWTCIRPIWKSLLFTFLFLAIPVGVIYAMQSMGIDPSKITMQSRFGDLIKKIFF